MELKPSQPPGRATRKLRGLVSEIARLKGEGYTNAAIQEALAAIGVHVGLTTVRRELARLASGSAAVSNRVQLPATSPSPNAQPPAAISKSEEPLPVTRPKIDDAMLAEYFDRPPPNPLFRKASKK